LLAEFADVAIAAPVPGPAALAAQAARMHKLKGSAGMLGAVAIRQLAGEAEASCRSGQAGQAAQLANRIASDLQRLRLNLAQGAAADDTGAKARAATPAHPIEPAAMAAFIGLLRQQDLSAVERFASLSAQLRARLGQRSHELLSEQMGGLRFADAALALEALQA
jgi:CRP-like cAMP-binding protein